ncbi:MAG TPA: Hsp20/alpha crystallin family protein [Gaiellaceae bacterium]|nr:Hsp20/alpha crystallin family protein [Gaiellaceae bacterium]
MSLMSGPQVETQHDGTLVFSLEIPSLVEDSIVVENDAEGRYTARAHVFEIFEHQSVPTEFKFEFVLPQSAGDPSWSYTDDVLRITIPPR